MARPGLTHHPKFARLARLVGSEVVALGSLEFLWLTAYENGDDLLGDAGDVEHLARWTGKPGRLAKALAESGFLDRKGKLYRVHDLWDHAPDYVQRRAEREAERRKRGETISTLRAEAGRKGAAVRWQTDGKRPPVASGADGKRMANDVTPAPAPAPAPAPENGTDARSVPETANGSFAPPAPPSAPPPSPSLSSPAPASPEPVPALSLAPVPEKPRKPKGGADPSRLYDGVPEPEVVAFLVALVCDWAAEIGKTGPGFPRSERWPVKPRANLLRSLRDSPGVPEAMLALSHGLSVPWPKNFAQALSQECIRQGTPAPDHLAPTAALDRMRKRWDHYRERRGALATAPAAKPAPLGSPEPAPAYRGPRPGDHIARRLLARPTTNPTPQPEEHTR